MGLFKLGRMTLKSLFSKPATKLYPTEPPVYYPETKGRVTVDIDTCIFDGSCANLCPTGALKVDRTDFTWSIDRFKCIQCRTCINNCAKHALTMDNHYTEPSCEHIVEVYQLSEEMQEKRRQAAAEKAERLRLLREEALAKKKAKAAEAQKPAQTPEDNQKAEPARTDAKEAKAETTAAGTEGIPEATE